jgi:hypothetical protein
LADTPSMLRCKSANLCGLSSRYQMIRGTHVPETTSRYRSSGHGRGGAGRETGLRMSMFGASSGYRAIRSCWSIQGSPLHNAAGHPATARIRPASAASLYSGTTALRSRTDTRQREIRLQQRRCPQR